MHFEHMHACLSTQPGDYNDLQWEIATLWVVIRINMHILLVTHNYIIQTWSILLGHSDHIHSYSYGLIRLDCNYSITHTLDH